MIQTVAHVPMLSSFRVVCRTTVYVYVCASVYVWAYGYLYVDMCVYVYRYVDVDVFVYVYVYLPRFCCMYIYTCIGAQVHLCVICDVCAFYRYGHIRKYMYTRMSMFLHMSLLFVDM